MPSKVANDVTSEPGDPMGNRRQPLEVRVWWHPDDLTPSEEAPVSLPDQIFMLLHLDPDLPASERLGMPVYFHTSEAAGAPVAPPHVPFDTAEKTLVVALVGDAIAGDEDWLEWTRELRKRADADPNVVFLGIALSEDASYHDYLFEDLNRERGQAQHLLEDPVAQDRFVRIAVLRTIATMLGDDARIEVFVSHAKADGSEVAAALAEQLRGSKSDAWVDVEQIEGGQDFGKVIERGVKRSVFVAVVTDKYATREWCRWEAQLAKQNGVPMVVLDLVSEGQRRSLPSLGNVPVIRLNSAKPNSRKAKRAYVRVVEAILAELVLSRYFPLTIETDSENIEPFHAPPELLSLAARKFDVDTIGVYPDPPLPRFERQLLEQSSTIDRLETPLSLLGPRRGGVPATGEENATPLALSVAISISNVDVVDLRSRSLSTLHVSAIFLQVCRHVLASGHDLVYGGDLRLMGFVQQLADIERAYDFRATGDRSERRIANFVAPYIHEDPGFKAASFTSVMKIEKIWRDRDPDPDETQSQKEALDLTEMREKMNAATDLRIVLGGNPTPGAVGVRRAPGIVEEAYIAATSEPQVPMVVIGGYGGAGAMVAQAIKGEIDERLEMQAAHFGDYPGPSFMDMISTLSDLGLAALGDNGLSPEQNGLMLTTTDSDYIVRNIVRSLHHLSRPL